MAELLPYDSGVDPGTPAYDTQCRVFGRVVSLSSAPLPFVALRFSLAEGGFYGATSRGALVTGDVVAVTRRDGTFYADLPRATALLVSAPWLRDPVSFWVPDADSASLVDLMWPYPVALRWYSQVEWVTGGWARLVEEPPGYVEADPGEIVDLGLFCEWSNGTRTGPLSGPRVEADGFLSVEALPDGIVRLVLPGSGQAWLESREADSGESLWDRVGYCPVDSPQRLPGTAYVLTDPGRLTFDVG